MPLIGLTTVRVGVGGDGAHRKRPSKSARSRSASSAHRRRWQHDRTEQIRRVGDRRERTLDWAPSCDQRAVRSGCPAQRRGEHLSTHTFQNCASESLTCERSAGTGGADRHWRRAQSCRPECSQRWRGETHPARQRRADERQHALAQMERVARRRGPFAAPSPARVSRAPRRQHEPRRTARCPCCGRPQRDANQPPSTAAAGQCRDDRAPQQSTDDSEHRRVTQEGRGVRRCRDKDAATLQGMPRRGRSTNELHNQTTVPALEAIRGHRSAHSFATGPASESAAFARAPTNPRSPSPSSRPSG